MTAPTGTSDPGMRDRAPGATPAIPTSRSLLSGKSDTLGSMAVENAVANAATESAVAQGFRDDRLSLVNKVAKLYYESEVRQSEIAERLNLSQSKVSRLLRQAEASGVVRTIVVSPEGLYSDIELALAERYGLLDAVVAEPLADDESSLLAALGSAGATYLEDTLMPNERIGISSWSSALLATVSSMAPRSTAKLADDIVQVIGGVGRPDVQVQANYLAARLAAVTGGTAHFFPAPGLVGTREACDALMHDSYIGRLTPQWTGLTTLLAGIGALRPSQLLASSGNGVGEAEAELLQGAGAVGDVCLRFFDAHGGYVESDINSRVVGIDVDRLRAVPRRLGVAGGERKYAAVRGAVLGGWVNVLVTDRETAVRLLEE